jgi:hypothetical protein
MVNLKTIAPERTSSLRLCARSAQVRRAIPDQETLRLSRRRCTVSHALVGGWRLFKPRPTCRKRGTEKRNYNRVLELDSVTDRSRRSWSAKTIQ